MTGDLESVIRGALAAQPPRAGSLVITVFGDCVAEQGGSVWQADLVRSLAAFALNERQVRTAIFRLGQDGWLESEQHGRRSLYRLTAFGQRQYAHAADRIYATGTPAWDGNWTLIMPAALPSATREEFRKRLGWAGFASLANGILAHPWPDPEALGEAVTELGVADDVLIWRARMQAHDGTSPALRELARDAWQLEAVGDRYDAFVRLFDPARRALKRGGDLDGQLAFSLRILLVHAYRRILLKTTDLPPALLPADWSGDVARELVAALYRRIHAAAAGYASEHLANAAGQLPPPGDRYYRRFGGLEGAAVNATNAALSL